MNKTSLSHGAFYLAVASFIFVLSGYLLNIWLGRSLGPSSYGIYGLIITLMTTINFAQTAGLPQAVAKFTSEDESKAESILKSSLVVQVVTTMLSAIGLFIFAFPIAKLLRDISLVPYIQTTSLVFPFYGVYALYLSYNNGMHYFKRQAIVSIVYAILKLVSIVSLVYFFHIYGAILGFIVSPLVALLFFFHIPKKDSYHFPYKKLILFSLPLIALAIFGTLLQSIDLFFVKALLKSNKFAGFYTANQNIAEIPFYAIPALTSVIFPSISRSVSQNLHNDAQLLVKNGLRFSLLILAPSVLVISATAPGLLSFFYSSSFLPGAGSLSILVFGDGFFTLFTLLSTIMSGSGSPQKMALISGIGVIISSLFCPILIPLFGMTGAAIATTSATVVIVILATLMVYKKFNVTFSLISSVKILVASLGLFFLAKIIIVPVVLIPIFYIFLSIVYMLILIFFKEITEEDMNTIKSLFPVWLLQKLKL